MHAENANRFVCLLFTLGLLLGEASPARADLLHTGKALHGFQAELPVRTVGTACPTQAQLTLWAAAEAAGAAWLPLRNVQSADVLGVALTDDARVLAHLKRVLGTTPPAGYSKAKGCANVLCALTAALDGSQEAALWALAIGADGGPVASLDQAPFKDSGESSWHASELRTLARALADLPAGLKKQVTKLTAFRRLPEGKTSHDGFNGYSTRDGIIFLRDTVWRMPVRQQREVIVHELGHELEFSRGSGFPISHSPEWRAFLGWELVGANENAKNAFRIKGSDAAATAVPSEEFPNTVAEYRYVPRLLRTSSVPRYEFVKKLYGGVEFLKPPADPGIDTAFAKLGGPLAVFNECGGLVQRSSFKPGWLQNELYVVRWTPTASLFSKVSDNAFVTLSPCWGMALEKLRQTPEWKQLACLRDDEDLMQAVATRLEEVWGAYAEASVVLRRLVTPERTASCLGRGELSVECWGGTSIRATAEAEAKKLAAEFAQGQAQTPMQLAALARQLLSATVLAPADDELFEKFPVLTSAEDYVGACLAGVMELSTLAGKQEWKYWVKNPPTNEVRGYTGPVASKACPRDFAAYLKTRGVTLNEDDPLFGHLNYLLRLKSKPVVERFKTEVLDAWPALVSACKIAPSTKATVAQQPCAQAFLQTKLSGVVSSELAQTVAKALASRLRVP